MEQTRALYEGAMEEFDRALKRMDELGAAHPDGSIAHAAKVYNFTLRNYHVALRDYNTFLLTGRLPPEPDKP